MQDLVTFVIGFSELHGGPITGILNGNKYQTDPKFEAEDEDEGGWKKHWLKRVSRSDSWWGAGSGSLTGPESRPWARSESWGWKKRWLKRVSRSGVVRVRGCIRTMAKIRVRA